MFPGLPQKQLLQAGGIGIVMTVYRTVRETPSNSTEARFYLQSTKGPKMQGSQGHDSVSDGFGMPKADRVRFQLKCVTS